MKNNNKNILLISGGNDSLYIYCKYNSKKQFQCIYFDYGQEYIDNELNILKEKEIPFEIIKIDNLKKLDNGFVEGRNFLFLLELSKRYDNINVFIGSNKDDIFTDNNRKFFSRLSYCINKSFNKKINIRLPLRNTTKKEILDFIKKSKIKTYSCYKKDGPCGKCKACLSAKEV